MKLFRLLAAALSLVATLATAAPAAPITSTFTGSIVQAGVERGYIGTFTYDAAAPAATSFASSTLTSFYSGAITDLVLTFENGDFVRAVGDIRVDNTYAPTARKTVSLYGTVGSASTSLSNLDRLSIQFDVPQASFDWALLNQLMNGDARLKLESGETLPTSTTPTEAGTTIPAVSTFSTGVNYVIQFGMIVAVQTRTSFDTAPQLTTFTPAVPEPSMYLLMAAGLLAVFFKANRLGLKL